MLRQILFVALLTLLALSASADKVVLHDGRSFEGKVVEKTDDHIVIKTRFAKMKFARGEIKEVTYSKTPRDIYAERKARLKAGDAEARWELARWCVSKGLRKEAKEMARQVIEIDADHAAAHEQLGHVRHEGKWVTRAEAARLKRGSGSGGAPPLEDKTKIKTEFASDAEKRAYVDKLFDEGKKRFDDSDISGARKYWNALMKYFPEAHYVDIIKGHLGIKEEKDKGGDDSMGGEEEQPKNGEGGDDQGGGYEDEFARPGTRKKKKPVVKPKKGDQPKSEKGDPDDPFGANRGGKEDKTEKKQTPSKKDDPFGAGKGDKEDKTAKKAPKKGQKDPKKSAKQTPKKKPEKKQKKGGPHKYARFFQIERVAIGSNMTTAGTYPEIQLQFKCYKRVKFITVIWYCATKKGKVFWSVHSFFGPDINTTHRKVAALTPKLESKHGRVVAGRVEIYYGTYKEREILTYKDVGKLPNSLRGKRWWDPEDDYEGQMVLYAPKTHPFETNTLKRYRSKH